MSLTRKLSKSKRVVTRPAEYKEIDEIVVERVIDDSGRRTVTAIVFGVGGVIVEDLSYGNYNKNPKWGDDELLDSLVNQLTA